MVTKVAMVLLEGIMTIKGYVYTQVYGLEDSVRFQEFICNYVLDVVKETSMLDYKPIDTPIDPMSSFCQTFALLFQTFSGELVSLVSLQWSLGCSHLNFEGSLGQGLLYENKGHSQVITYSDVDWAMPLKFFLEILCSCWRYPVLWELDLDLRMNIMIWPWSHVTCELIWIKQLIEELKFTEGSQMKLFYDSETTLHIASNLIFHERTKHIKVDSHFTRKKVVSSYIVISYINSMNNWLTFSLVWNLDIL
ncbi:hypothetical protein CR513_26465, partial [Mucuna pruriens]